MSCVELKRQLHRSYVIGDLAQVSQIVRDYPPAAKWGDRFIDHQPYTAFVPSMGHKRLINNFCIGSDPEFVFVRKDKKANALSDCGLFVGLAAGSDQNERLAELRPWPSTSVVEHVAGILTILRWMYRVHPVTRAFAWRAGAFFGGDGLGGHVHFGRKKETRDSEIQAMNSLSLTFGALGLFPLQEWDYRRQGDQRGQLYGKFSDTRSQAHGYEYRTMPSWLHTPDAAFLVLAASKLAMLDPEMVIPWAYRLKDARQNLLLLAKYYRSRDDDALLLYNLLQMRMPRITFSDLDFKQNWGFSNAILTNERPAEERWILPSSIQPQPSEVEEMYRYLTGTVDSLGFAELPPNFVHQIPRTYVWAPCTILPGKRGGVGDVIHNMVISPELNVNFHFFAHDEGSLAVSKGLVSRWSPEEVKRYETEFHGRYAQLESDGSFRVAIPEHLRKPPSIKQLRRLLFESGLFPLWTVDTVTAASAAEWIAAHPSNRTKKQKALDRSSKERVRFL